MFYSPKSDQCNEYVKNELSLNQVQRCVECAKERKYNMDIQREHKQKSDKTPTTKPVIKNVLRKNRWLNNKVFIIKN